MWILLSDWQEFWLNFVGGRKPLQIIGKRNYLVKVVFYQGYHVAVEDRL